MNKTEKKLAKKILDIYQSATKSNTDFTPEESRIIERWRVHRIINKDALIDVTSMASDHKEYILNRNYPFTSYGDDEIKKDWYLHFRSSKGIIITRDILTILAFFISLYIALITIFQK